jgi:hypothetical protein
MKSATSRPGLVAITVAAMATRLVAQNATMASPRMRSLEQEFARDKAAALERFWRDAKTQCPLVEAIDGDNHLMLVTFLWRGDESIERIEVRGGPFATSREPFVQLGDSDVWYHSERLPKDARNVYGLVTRRRIERRGDDGTTQQDLVEEYPNDPPLKRAVTLEKVRLDRRVQSRVNRPLLRGHLPGIQSKVWAAKFSRDDDRKFESATADSAF